MPLSPGDVIAGRFAIESLAGSGGMGLVYRAIDRLSGAPVALKVLHGLVGEHARFAREAEVLATLRHPGIVRHATHGTTAAGAPYRGMEWVEGETLNKRIARQVLSAEETLDLGARIARALGHAHERGVVHR